MSFANLKTIPVTGEKDNSFVGIKISKGMINFFYPDNFELSKDDNGLRKDIFLILKTIRLAKTRMKERTYNCNNYKDRFEFPLSSYLWMINDYINKGPYKNYSTKIGNADGKIEWKKTIAKQYPLITSQGFIFTNLISSKKHKEDDLLSEIYLYCVKKSFEIIGWIFKLKFDKNDPEIELKFNKIKYINCINKFLTSTYNDDHRIRLVHMKNILTGLDDGNVKSSFSYGVESYDFVYESMIDYMFSNIKDIKKFYPSGTWNLELKHEEKDSSKLRPDTIIEHGDDLYIIDAKNYRYGKTFSSNDLPKTDSIQKQLTYVEFAKNNFKKYKKIYTAFILPYNMANNKEISDFNEKFEYIGYANAKWDQKYDSNDSVSIAGILMDTRYLVENYTNKNKDDCDQLISIIKKYIEGIDV